MGSLAPWYKKLQSLSGIHMHQDEGRDQVNNYYVIQVFMSYRYDGNRIGDSCTSLSCTECVTLLHNEVAK